MRVVDVLASYRPSGFEVDCEGGDGLGREVTVRTYLLAFITRLLATGLGPPPLSGLLMSVQ